MLKESRNQSFGNIQDQYKNQFKSKEAQIYVLQAQRHGIHIFLFSSGRKQSNGDEVRSTVDRRRQPTQQREVSICALET